MKMRKQTGGFTLLEVMIAVAILAIGLVAVFQMQSQSISMASEARFRTTASLLAQSKMTDVEASRSLSNRTESGNFAPEHPDYGWSLKITDTMIPGFKRIEVSVHHQGFMRGGIYELVFYKTGGR
jgi:general secretion pathway protein I